MEETRGAPRFRRLAVELLIVVAVMVVTWGAASIALSNLRSHVLAADLTSSLKADYSSSNGQAALQPVSSAIVSSVARDETETGASQVAFEPIFLGNEGNQAPLRLPSGEVQPAATPSPTARPTPTAKATPTDKGTPNAKPTGSGASTGTPQSTKSPPTRTPAATQPAGSSPTPSSTHPAHSTWTPNPTAWPTHTPNAATPYHVTRTPRPTQTDQPTSAPNPTSSHKPTHTPKAHSNSP